MKKWRKSIFIGIGAVALSTLGLQASDMFRGVENNLTGLVIDSAGPCGPGAVQLLLGVRSLCVDIYEASASEKCEYSNITTSSDTQTNLNIEGCKAVSVQNAIPWRFVTFTQAQQLCARSGKRLPDNEEWYRAASGMTDVSSCVIDTKNSTPSNTGKSSCVSPLGVYDMIGNVWEWVDEEIVNGQYNNRPLPETGYVTSVDTEGVVVETGKNALKEFGNDYAWTDSEGVKAMIRGGFYGSGEDAGIFAQNLSVPLNFKTAGVGFRCVKDI